MQNLKSLVRVVPYMRFAKKTNNKWIPFLLHNPIISCYYGWFTATWITVQLNIFMKDVFDFYAAIKPFCIWRSNEKDGAVSIQHKNIQTIAVDMFQIKNNMFHKCWHRLACWLHFYHFLARLLRSNASQS